MYLLKGLGMQEEFVLGPIIAFFGGTFLTNYIRQKLRDRFGWDWTKLSNE